MLLGAFLSITGGFIGFLLGQFTLALVITPMQEFRKTIGEASYILLKYRSKLTNAVIDVNISDELKSISAKLVSSTNAISLYSLVSKIFRLPSKDDVFAAAQEMNTLYYNTLPESRAFDAQNENGEKCNHACKNNDAIRKIGELLKIKVSY
ncbi:MAG: hypothetical protein WBI40_07030 [Methylococcaceae bacterium]